MSLHGSTVSRCDDWIVAPWDAPARMHGMEVPSGWKAVVLLTPPLERARSVLAKFLQVYERPKWRWLVDALGGESAFATPSALLAALVLTHDVAGKWALLQPQSSYVLAAETAASEVTRVTLRRGASNAFGEQLASALTQCGVVGLKTTAFAKKHASSESVKREVAKLGVAELERFVTKFWPLDAELFGVVQPREHTTYCECRKGKVM